MRHAPRVKRKAARAPGAAPEGFGSSGTHAVNQTLYKNPMYNAVTDFAPVALISELLLFLVARKDLAVATLPDFIANAREHQAKMQYSSSGVGSTNHLACALFNSVVGINATR